MDLVPPPREQDPPDAPTGSEREPAHGGHDRLAHRLKQVAKGDEVASRSRIALVVLLVACVAGLKAVS